ncbi:MAG: AAA family ATPase [Bacteroidota bacterium]|nr:AAA family ATPase [Bacteroidota bacterium]
MSNLPEKAEIRAAINAYCQEKAISKANLARSLKISPAVLSQIENEKWDGISEEVLLRIWHEVRPVEHGPRLVNTHNLSTAERVCGHAQQNQLMIALLGNTGLGKTTALERYARRPRVYYVAYDKAMRPKDFFAALLQEMGVSFAGSVYQMLGRIAEELNGKKAPLVIIDEAGKLTHQMYLYLHSLREKTKRNAGIVLAGMPYFQANLLKDVERQKEGAAEFYRRINLWESLLKPTTAEKTAVCEAHGVTDTDTVRAMQRYQDFGNLTNALLLEKLHLNNL